MNSRATQTVGKPHEHGQFTRQPAVSALVLTTEGEQDFYQGEALGVVLHALAEQLGRTPEHTRRWHILHNILTQNAQPDPASESRNQIRQLLRSYHRMDHRLRQALLNLGFEINDNGKHYKLRFHGDPRYLHVLPKTTSDRQSGRAAAADLIRQCF